jgi:4-amino-4-deoxy-L-arabinose transferase-like glycosyltransferase
VLKTTRIPKDSITNPLFLVLALSLVLNVCAVWWGLPSQYGWAPDEIPPYITLEGVRLGFAPDWHQPAYPPLHYYLVGLSALPVVALDGLGWLDVNTLYGHTLLFYLGRSVSLLMSVGILIAVYQCGLMVYDRKAARFATLIAALSTPFVYYSKTANLDVPLTFWFIVSLYFFLKHLETKETRYFLFFSMAAVAAICTKDQAFAFYVLPLFFYFYRRCREQGAILKVLLDRQILLAMLVSLVLFFTLHNVFFNYQGFVHHLVDIFWARGHYAVFDNTPADHLRMLGQSVRQVNFALGLPLAIVSLLGMGLLIKNRRENPLALWILASGLSYYLFFITVALSPWLRYFVPLGLVLAFCGGRFFSDLLDHRSKGYRIKQVLVAAVFLYSFLRAASVNVWMLNDSRYFVEQWMAENVEGGAVVGYIGPEYYLPRLFDYNKRGLRPTDTVLARQSPDYLVLNPDYFSRFEPGTRAEQLFSDLRAGRTGYGLVLRHQSQTKWMLLDFEGVLTNIAKINPEIEVYQRAR